MAERRPQPPTPGTSPARPRTIVRRAVKVLLLVDAALLVVALVLWVQIRRGDEAGNVVNAGLRGSRPPAGQTLPDLSRLEGVRPSVPAPAQLEGRAVALVATCLQCRSGDIIGGFLGRLRPADIPAGAQVRVVGWGDAEAWRTKWAVPGEFTVHEVPVASTERARRAFGIGPVDGAEESGVAYLHDPRGRWRSSFFLGQLDRDDMLHDLEALAEDA